MNPLKALLAIFLLVICLGLKAQTIPKVNSPTPKKEFEQKPVTAKKNGFKKKGNGTNYNSQQYAEAKPVTKTPVAGNAFYLFDSFSDNSNDWALASDEEREMKIENGKFRIRGINSDRTYKTCRDFDIDINEDFTVSVATKWIEGTTSRTYGVICCGNTAYTSRYDFCISNEGSYLISFLEADKWRNLKEWTKFSYINKGSIPNFLIIKKQGNYISFYINDHLAESFPFDGGYGSVFGLTSEADQIVDFDNFILKGTKK